MKDLGIILVTLIPKYFWIMHMAIEWNEDIHKDAACISLLFTQNGKLSQTLTIPSHPYSSESNA